MRSSLLASKFRSGVVLMAAALAAMTISGCAGRERPRLAYELLCLWDSMEGHMSERHDPTCRIHLCDCNRSFALDAGRLSGSTGAALHCHHALCGAELPALDGVHVGLFEVPVSGQ